MNMTKVIGSLEPNQEVFINRKLYSSLSTHMSSVRSIAHNMSNRKFSVNKVSPSIFTKKCGALVTRIV